MASNLLMFCLLSTIAVLSEAQSFGGRCRTTENRYGTCVPIQNCEILFRLTSVAFSDVQHFIERNKCGTRETDVCCPDADGQITTSTARSNTFAERYASTARSNTFAERYASTERYNTFAETYKPTERYNTFGETYVPTERYNTFAETYVPPTTPRRYIQTRPTEPPRTTPRPSRISARKCNDYSDFAYNKTFTFNVVTDIRMSKISNCAFVSQSEIFGGVEAKRREFPHQALIGFTYNGRTHWDCGGTLISEQFVLSASHCSNSIRTGPALYVRLGEHDLSRTNDAIHQDFDIIETIIHQNVPRRTLNDIVLFKLDREVVFNHAIRPACLPEHSAVPRNVYSSGWGNIETGVRSSDVLLKVDLTTFSPTERQRTDVGRVYSTTYDPSTVVFAGHLTNRRPTCQGDVGGPLQIQHDTHHCTYVVVGVTSTGVGCGNAGTPTIYTGVYSHLDWIEETVWPNEY